MITSAKTLSACQKFGNGAFWYNDSLCVNQTANDPASCTQVTVDTLIFCTLLDDIKTFWISLGILTMDHVFVILSVCMWKWGICSKVFGMLCQSLASLCESGLCYFIFRFYFFLLFFSLCGNVLRTENVFYFIEKENIL